MSLYEVLKASKTNRFPDYWTLLWGRKISASMIKTITGVLPLTFTAKGGNAADWVIEGNDEPGENLLKIMAESQTVNNVQITINADKTVTVNGTASENIFFNLSTISFSPGAYTLSSGGVGVTSNGTALLYAYDVSYHICNPNDKTWILSEPKDISFVVWISSGTAVDNLTFKPMFVKGSTAPDHYIPYQQGVGERTENKANPDNVEFITLNNRYGVKITGAGIWQIVAFDNVYTQVHARVYDSNNEWRGDATVIVNATGTTFLKEITLNEGDTLCVYDPISNSSEQIAKNKIREDKIVAIKSDTAPTTYIPYGYQIPLTVSQQGQTDKSYTFYIGDTPLTEGQQVSKTSTGQDIELFEGENTISTTLYNKPTMEIKYK